MPQYGNAAFIANNTSGNPAAAALDSAGELLTATGGNKSSLHIGAAAVIKATPGRLCRIVVVAPGSTGGAFTFNDCAATGDATATNQVWSVAYNATTNVAGAVFDLEFPCGVGIVLSAVPTGGTPLISVSFI